MTKTAEQVLAEVAEPDRLTLAARECCHDTGIIGTADNINSIRAIIAREVAAAEPSDEAIHEAVMLFNSGNWTYDSIRAALKGDGA